LTPLDSHLDSKGQEDIALRHHSNHSNSDTRWHSFGEASTSFSVGYLDTVDTAISASSDPPTAVRSYSSQGSGKTVEATLWRPFD
jgi:hypothetical protein